MIKAKNVREALETLTEEHGPGPGRVQFVKEFHKSLGLGTDEETGNPEADLDEFGRPRFGEGRLRPSEMSLAQIGEGIFGIEKFRQVMNPAGGGGGMLQMLEAGPGIDPTTFVNINTYNLAVAGLVNAKIMENFLNPAFIGDELVENQPTKNNGEKRIGATLIGDKALTRNPGEPHPRAGFGEQWVKTPETVEKALCVEVSKEAAFYDLTGQVLQNAGKVGDELGYRRESTIADLVLGVTNSYSYKDTTYNTYQTATPWINSIAAAFESQTTDYSVIDAARQLFVNMTDPATGKEILVTPDTMLVSPSRRLLAGHILNATQVYEGSQLSATYGFPGRQTIGSNPLQQLGMQPKILESSIFFNRMTAAAGLALSASDAKKTWFYGQPKKAFAWMENWPLRVQTASPSEYVMLDRGVIAAYFANYRGVGAVLEPRYVLKLTP